MSLSVKIIDNETGEVFIDEPNCQGVMGAAIAPNRESSSIFNRSHTQCFAYIRCNKIGIYHLFTGVQRILFDTQRKHPDLDEVAGTIAKLDELSEMIEKFGYKDGD